MRGGKAGGWGCPKMEKKGFGQSALSADRGHKKNAFFFLREKGTVFSDGAFLPRLASVQTFFFPSTVGET